MSTTQWTAPIITEISATTKESLGDSKTSVSRWIEAQAATETPTCKGWDTHIPVADAKRFLADTELLARWVKSKVLEAFEGSLDRIKNEGQSKLGTERANDVIYALRKTAHTALWNMRAVEEVWDRI